MIYRDEHHTKNSSKERGVVEVIISKQRNGPTRYSEACLISKITKFESVAHDVYSTK